MKEIKVRIWAPEPKEFWFKKFGDVFYLKENDVLEEFTTRRDKNGKDIYEGDIILADDGGEFFPEQYDEKKDDYFPCGKYRVFWDNSTAGWGIKGLDGSLIDLEHVPFSMDANYEIVGNIHQNPELLTKGA